MLIINWDHVCFEAFNTNTYAVTFLDKIKISRVIRPILLMNVLSKSISLPQRPLFRTRLDAAWVSYNSRQHTNKLPDETKKYPTLHGDS